MRRPSPGEGRRDEQPGGSVPSTSAAPGGGMSPKEKENEGFWDHPHGPRGRPQYEPPRPMFEYLFDSSRGEAHLG